jgi:hypothetical protein
MDFAEKGVRDLRKDFSVARVPIGFGLSNLSSMEPLRQSLYHWHRLAVSLYEGHIAWPLVVASAVPDRVTYSPVVAALLLPSTRDTTPIKKVVPRF